MVPDSEIVRARQLRVKMTKENRSRARIQVANITKKYGVYKNAMLAGKIKKTVF